MFTLKNQELSTEEKIKNILDNEPALDFIDKLKKELPDLELDLVGGMVRDIIMGNEKNSKDYDFVAKNIDIDTLIATLQKFGKVDLVGQNFGVLKFWPKGKKLKEAIDIALPRKEFSQGTGGYRDFDSQADENMSIKEDLSRRDLTINAIAYNLNAREVIDPYNGIKDIKNEIIRAVGQPAERFQEDYSRMLRALRFACKLNFRLDKKTWLAIKKFIPHLNDERLDKKNKPQRVVPRETITKELLKILQADPGKALDLLDQSNALEQIIPEMLSLKGCEQPPEFHSEGDVWQHIKLMLKTLESDEFKQQFPDAKITGSFVLGVMLHDIGKPPTRTETDGKLQFFGHDKAGEKIAAQIAKRLKLTGKQQEQISFMVKNHMFAMTVQDVFAVKANKFAKRFLDSPFSQDLLMLFYLDSFCSKRPDSSAPMKNFKDTLKRIEEIKKIRENQPQKIISGQEIMKILDVPSGPFIRVVLSVISELKNLGKINEKKEAIKFLEKNKKLLLKYKNKDCVKNRDSYINEILSKI